MQRNHFIDVLKGILIIFVIVLHYPIDANIEDILLFPFWITQTVPCFFFLTGYVYALSFKRRGVEKIQDAYKGKRILEQVIRYTIPFAMAFIAEWIVFRLMGLYTVNIVEYGIFAFILDFLRGGKGMGSYYFPLMIQCIFIFPLVYFIIKKFNFKGLIYCFLANLFFEIVKLAYYMNDAEYRLLIFRYIFIMAAGCYFAVGKIEKNRKQIVITVISIVIGLFFCYLFAYTTYEPKILMYWRTTSLVVCLYVAPVLGWLVRKINFKFGLLEFIGKASFNIFLVQMIYYIFAERMYAIIPHKGLQLVFNIINCVVVGVLFYLFESKITKFIIKKTIKKSETK